ncbi:MAG: hypothetical protein FWB87_15900 [Defluviitaleaceae bacterium]|nr:hypothetical protein [Defluviitaleaceae bacterium]MCL2263945.1 hypothetical protein [Defluviitaleaceae bacterium]
MQAVQGLVTEGRFTPTNNIPLPRYAHAILIIEETPTPPTNTRKNFWNEFDKMAKASKHEPMPDFPRFQMGREPITFDED